MNSQNSASKKTIRPATHAGSWYEDDSEVLSNEIQTYFDKAKQNNDKNESINSKKLKAIIVPHAGYIYSGETAACAFIHIDPSKYSRAVVLGPSHYASFTNCAMTSYKQFETPFGNLPIDTEAIDLLVKKYPSLFHYASSAIDKEEHSIEMELPFLKYIFDKNKISVSLIPIIVGFSDINSITQIGGALNELFKDEKTLFIISSDFCHWGSNFDYLFYDATKGKIWESIQYYDLLGVELIKKMNVEEIEKYFDKYENTICGRYPIEILMKLGELNNIKESNSMFRCEKYAQSEKVLKKTGNSVSYAGCVLYI